MNEAFRYGLASFFMLVGVLAVLLSVLGVFKFRFVMNRMHCAAIIDTMGLLFIVLSLMTACGSTGVAIKLAVILAMVWVGSPISSHLVGRMEISTDETLQEHMKFMEKKGDGEDGHS